MTYSVVSAAYTFTDGTTVRLSASEAGARSPMDINIVFAGAEQTNYDIVAMQSGQTVLD